MLVLTRRKNESIQIGTDIELKILEIEGDQVKLGIKAPSHIDIYRKEIYLDIQKQNSEAVNNNSLDVLRLLNEKQEKS